MKIWLGEKGGVRNEGRELLTANVGALGKFQPQCNWEKNNVFCASANSKKSSIPFL